MAQKILSDRIYNDSWFFSLSVKSKWLFIFLLTNSSCNLIGCYEIPLKIISTYTGLNEKLIKESLLELKDKILYFEGWIIIKNYEKYNPMKNPSIELSKKKQLASIPLKISEVLTGCGQGVDRVLKLLTPKTQIEKEIEIENKGVVKGKEILDDETFIKNLKQKFPNHDIDEEIEKMKDWFKSTGKTKKDYAAFARNWLRQTEPKKEKINLPSELASKMKDGVLIIS